MKTETTALGKDSPYHESISKLRQALRDHGFEVEEVSWQNPVPNVWSVHLRDKNCPQLFTNGKGHSQEAALASALGEFHERLACNFFFGEYYFGKTSGTSPFVHHPSEKWFPLEEPFALETILPEELSQFYDEAAELSGQSLIDFNSGDMSRGICTLPFTRIEDNQQVFFPVNILNNLYVSNGMAAGNSLHEARVQALSEIIERHVKNRIISECITLPNIPREILDQYPHIMSGIEKLEKEGFHILVKDASLHHLRGNDTDIAFPVVNVTLLNPKNNGVFAAFGAHPLFEVALERTLTELLQGRSLDTLGEFPSPALCEEDVANPRNLEMHFVDSTGVLHYSFLRETPDYPYFHWDFAGSTEQQYEYLVSLLHRQGAQIYVANYTHFGVYCCRIIVPGISEIYPVEDLIWENKSLCIPMREAMLAPGALPPGALRSLYEFMDEMSFPREQPVFDLLGILPSEDSLWGSLCVGEFNAQLCLATSNAEDARLWCEWCASSPLLSLEKQTLYKCIQTMLTIMAEAPTQLENYSASLRKLYGDTTFVLAHSMVKQTPFFRTLPAFEEQLQVGSDFAPHRKLLEAYQKCQQAKAANR